jgi:hypothetical protein
MATNRTEGKTSGTSGSSGRGSAGSTAGSTASAAPQTQSAQTSGEGSHQEENSFAQRLRNGATERLVGQKNRAIGELDTIADAIRGTGRQLREQDHNAVANYIEGAADQLHSFSQRLQNKDVGEIVEEIQRFGRSRPALFVGLAFGAGLLGARFMKSSGEDDGGYYGNEYPGGYRSTSSAGDWRRPSTSPAYGQTGGTTGTLPGRSGNLGSSNPADLG